MGAVEKKESRKLVGRTQGWDVCLTADCGYPGYGSMEPEDGYFFFFEGLARALAFTYPYHTSRLVFFFFPLSSSSSTPQPAASWYSLIHHHNYSCSCYHYNYLLTYLIFRLEWPTNSFLSNKIRFFPAIQQDVCLLPVPLSWF